MARTGLSLSVCCLRSVHVAQVSRDNSRALLELISNKWKKGSKLAMQIVFEFFRVEKNTMNNEQNNI